MAFDLVLGFALPGPGEFCLVVLFFAFVYGWLCCLLSLVGVVCAVAIGSLSIEVS